MKEPTVTIVVPTYKRLHYLQEALPSALRQTYRDFEVIVSDDGASKEIADYVASLSDPRIRYRGNVCNMGIAMNNFSAFAEARGKYIASLHDDDLWEPDFLETLVPLLEADETVTVAFCDHHIIDDNGRFLIDHTEENTRFYGRHLLTPGRHQPFLKAVAVDLTIPMVMAAVFRKSILAGADFSPRVGGCYDHWLAYLAVGKGQAGYYVPRRLTRYRVHSGSGTASQAIRNYRNAIYVRKRLLQDDNLSAYRSGIRNGIGVIYGKMALYFLSRNSTYRARVLFKQAFRFLNRPKNMVALAVNGVKIWIRKNPN